MDLKIVLRHISGAKKTQTESVAVSDDLIISLGRDHGSTIQFDPDRDDTVSRNHAKIKVADAGKRFLLSDCGSTHGTYLNGQRISGDAELAPGDEIELGRGVKVVFDLDPRPQHFVARTRVINAMDIPPKATTVVNVPVEPEPTRVQPVHPSRTQQTPPPTGSVVKKLIVPAIAGVVALIASLVYFKTTHNDKPVQEMTPVVVSTNPDTGLTTQQIAERYSDSTVYIEVKWRLIDQESGKPIYHKQLTFQNGDKLPLYVYLGDQNPKVVPWLTTDDDEGRNKPISVHASGSGFVVKDSGFILTNKHVAAGWMISGDVPSKGYLVPANAPLQGIIQGLSDKGLFAPAQVEKIREWIPGRGGYLFESGRSSLIGKTERDFTGRLEILQVKFPGAKFGLDAKLVRFSSEADVALIKIESPNIHAPVELSDDGVKLGQKVTVIGYPGISQKSYIYETVNEGGDIHQEATAIQQATVTDGVISNLGKSGVQSGGAAVIGMLGDVYQLTVTATGHGNSGGPVFDEKGKVIGLFTYSISRGDERVTFAVPIKYGMRLLN